MSIVTRAANLRDITKLNQLVNSVYRGENALKGWTTEALLLDGQRIDDEMLKEIIAAQTQRIFLLEEGQQILGCVHSTDKDDSVFLGMLSVDVEQQGRGLGYTLMRAVEEDAKNRKFKKVKMHVLSNREELLNWYYRKGYKNTGEKAPFPYGDPKYGLPKTDNLEFLVLEKVL